MAITSRRKKFPIRQAAVDAGRRKEAETNSNPSDEQGLVILGVLIFVVCWGSAGWAIFNHLTGTGVSPVLSAIAGIIGGFIATVIAMVIGMAFFSGGGVW